MPFSYICTFKTIQPGRIHLPFETSMYSSEKNKTLVVTRKKELDLEYICHNLLFLKEEYTICQAILGVKVVFSIYLYQNLS